MLRLNSWISILTFLVIPGLLVLQVQSQSSEPPPNIRKILKLAKTAQPDLCYSFCETCQSGKQEYYTCSTCEKPYMKSVPPFCNIESDYNVQCGLTSDGRMGALEPKLKL